MRRKEILVNLSCILISLLVLFIPLEMSVRAYQSWKWKIPFFESFRCGYDSELGWGAKEIFPKTQTKKLKILFIGDSFTGGFRIDEKFMYYNVAARLLDADIFVFAGGAYGTLQEYIGLNKYFYRIKPDLVVLQVCSNDFINNSWDLEKSSFYFNEQMIRPYLIDGNVELRYPRDFGKFSKALCRSRLFFVLSNRIEESLSMLAKKGWLHTVEKDIEEKRLGFDKFKKAVNITEKIILKMKAEVGRTPLIAFSVDDTEPYFQQFKNIFKHNNIEFFTDVPDLVREKEKQGINTMLKDGHWNETGHLICGENLARKIKQLNLRKAAD